MTPDLVIQGVLLPAAAATVFILASLLVGAVLRSKAQRRTDASSSGSGGALRRWAHERFDGASPAGPAIAFAFALSLFSRDGARWPPASAWEWIAPLVAVTAVVAWFLPRRQGPAIWLAPIIAGGLTAWALALPGFDQPLRRGAIGIVAAAVAAAFAWSARGDGRDSRAVRASELLAASIALAGAALVVIASAFASLAIAISAAAFTFAAASLVACFARPLRLGAAGGVTAGTLLVAGAATGAAYTSVDLPFWHWAVAVAAPFVALVADIPRSSSRPRPALRASLRLVIVSIVSIGNGVAALWPSMARGDFAV